MFSLMVIARAAQIRVCRGGDRLGLALSGQCLLIETVFENRLQAFIAHSADGQGARRTRFKPRRWKGGFPAPRSNDLPPSVER